MCGALRAMISKNVSIGALSTVTGASDNLAMMAVTLEEDAGADDADLLSLAQAIQSGNCRSSDAECRRCISGAQGHGRVLG